MSAAQPRYRDAAGGLGVIIRVEGFEASIRYRMTELKARLAKFGETEEISDPWAEVKDLPAWAPLDTVWKVSVRPTDALNSYCYDEGAAKRLWIQLSVGLGWWAHVAGA